MIYSRNEHEDCQTATNLRFAENRLSLTEETNNDRQIDFSYQKNYLSLQLQYKLHSEDCEEFLKILLNEILRLQQFSIETKFTVHCDQKVIYNNHVSLDDDYKSCQVLAGALTNIIKHSVNIKFKENCFSMLRVNNSHEVESSFMTKLLPLIHENYIFPNDN